MVLHKAAFAGEKQEEENPTPTLQLFFRLSQRVSDENTKVRIPLPLGLAWFAALVPEETTRQKNSCPREDSSPVDRECMSFDTPGSS